MITPPASWSRIVADHENLWTEIADRLSPIAPNAWDLLICELDDVYGTTVIAPAKQNAPFWLPESPGDDERQHFEVLHEASVCLEIPEFDLGGKEGDPTPEEWASARQVHIHALYESLAGETGKAAVDRLGAPNTFTIAWSPRSESAWFVHLHHVHGAPLGKPVPARTAYGALAPLFWHHHSFVGRYHSGLVFDGDVLVEATLVGPDVTDETLELLTPESAACCASLRVLRLQTPCPTPPAIERLRELLPTTRIEVG